MSAIELLKDRVTNPHVIALAYAQQKAMESGRMTRARSWLESNYYQ